MVFLEATNTITIQRTGDAGSCTASSECKGNCFDKIIVQFSEPQYLQTFAVMGGLEDTSGQPSHFCWFKQTVVKFNGEEQKTWQDKVTNRSAIAINKPADTVELKIGCLSADTGINECAMTVIETDVSKWKGLILKGTW